MVVKQYRHICPCNCYSACGIVSQVEEGRIKELSGDPQHGFTRGFLCAKGHAYLDTAFHQDRLRYPLLQQPRGSGRFKRISWDEATSLITSHLTTIYDRHDSYLPVCFYNNSGNLGILHRAWTWLAEHLSATLVSGSICWSAGLDALYYDVGHYTQPHPENMRQSRCIICWGANPAWTAIHQMEYIQQARENGARLIVIDPIYTATAAQADRYIQVHPGTDGALALVIAHYLCRAKLIDEDYIASYIEGWPAFYTYLMDLNVSELLRSTGVDETTARELAEELAVNQPAAIWLGFGLQRHTNGGQNFRTISALAAITGNIAREGGGIYYANTTNLELFYTRCRQILRQAKPVRTIPSYDFANALGSISENSIKMLFLANANPLIQNAETDRFADVFTKLDFIVVADQFLTATARQADLVLPVTNYLEHWDVVASYWHNWVGINQPAIKPPGECRSDLAIVGDIAGKLQSVQPSTSGFPRLTEEEWLDRLFDSELCRMLNIKSYADLLEGPRRVTVPDNPWSARPFATPTGKYELLSNAARKQGLPALPRYRKPRSASAAYPYRLITPHTSEGLNSQFFVRNENDEISAYIHPVLAERIGLKQGGKGRIFNHQAEFTIRIVCTPTVPADTVVIYQQPYTFHAVNSLASPLPTDMGEQCSGGPALAYYDVFVNISPISI